MSRLVKIYLKSDACGTSFVRSKPVVSLSTIESENPFLVSKAHIHWYARIGYQVFQTLLEVAAVHRNKNLAELQITNFDLSALIRCSIKIIRKSKRFGEIGPTSQGAVLSVRFSLQKKTENRSFRTHSDGYSLLTTKMEWQNQKYLTHLPSADVSTHFKPLMA